ncbi:MAG: GNAT family N-acetyltransferase [Bacteroidetes bacterium]|nr:MAG: GNAT family N-acetyltransferase [Bacteroidota bacterium]
MQDFTFHPVTKTRWKDLEHLFGSSGAFCGCWCMWWRLPRKEVDANKSAGNKAAMHRLIASGVVPGILAFDGTNPVGWCAVAPRIELDSLNRSRVLKRLDDEPVWSITCFFIAKPYRNQGLMEQLIRAGVEHAKTNGGNIVEAYPHTAVTDRLSAVSIFTGLPEPFERAGFRICKQASKAKVIMRLTINDN